MGFRMRLSVVSIFSHSPLIFVKGFEVMDAFDDEQHSTDEGEDSHSLESPGNFFEFWVFG